jgi:hypothetical protein
MSSSPEPVDIGPGARIDPDPFLEPFIAGTESSRLAGDPPTPPWIEGPVA